MKKLIFFLFLGLLLITPIMADDDGGIQITKLKGELVYGGNSNLQITIIVLNDSSCPLKINEAKLAGNYSTSNRSFSFDGSTTIFANESITAFELRYVLYDVFNTHIKTLSYSAIRDTNSGEKATRSASWYANSNEASNLLTVIAFVGKVRKADGTIWKYNEKAVLIELLKVEIDAKAEELNPNAEK